MTYFNQIVFEPGERIAFGDQTGVVCPNCLCLPRFDSAVSGNSYCKKCGNSGFVSPTGERLTPQVSRSLPGTKPRVAMYAIRYANGEPLWNPRDCRDDSRRCVPATLDTESDDADED